jgi:hypothetical protein
MHKQQNSRTLHNFTSRAHIVGVSDWYYPIAVRTPAYSNPLSIGTLLHNDLLVFGSLIVMFPTAELPLGVHGMTHGYPVSRNCAGPAASTRRSVALCINPTVEINPPLLPHFRGTFRPFTVAVVILVAAAIRPFTVFVSKSWSLQQYDPSLLPW